ncbi:hypothetical protein AMA39_15940 [Salmonella enterica subsp. enterica serovar Senftenberg]|nr:hypothetical protein [Salmonella enterica subsp. enterica serovar Senftenberg]
MTDVTMNESEHKVPDVNTRSPRTSDNSRRVVQSKNEHYGMATVTITPGTPDFNRFLTARNRSVIRGFDDVSIAISSLFRTVNAVKHPELVQAIQDWFNELHEENNLMKNNLERHIATIHIDESDPFFSSTEFSPFRFEPVQLNFNNQNTMRFYKHIFEMNNLLTQMHKFNSLGQLPVSDYNVMAHNIIRSLNMYIERVKKTLNVSRRAKGTYSPDEFIEKVKQYKSVQAYIAAELSGKRR